MKYNVQRQDERGVWQPMADTDDFNRAKSLCHDAYRRIMDQQGNIIYIGGQKMGIRDYFRAAMVGAWRLIQGMIIMPAAAVGILLAGTALLGQQPVTSTLETIHHYAEANVRPASAGHVLITECVSNPVPANDVLSKPSLICDSTTSKEVTTAEAIASIMDTLQKLYLALIGISFGALLMAFPGRRFFGLPEQPTAA